MTLMNIDQIITKVLAGQASAEELASLNAWKQESEDNLSKLSELRMLHETADGLRDYQAFDTDAAWTNVSTQLHTTPTYRSRWVWLGLLIAVAVGVYYLMQREETPAGPSVYIAADDMLPVTLLDGTIVHLDKGGRLEVPTDWEDSRKVALAGRAFFDVKKQPGGKSFVVELDQGVITVVGTAFAVEASAGEVEVGVQEGHVVYSLDSRKVDLLADDRVQLINGTLAKTSGLGGHYFSWVHRKLAFDDMLVAEAVPKLAHHVNKQIIVSESVDLSNCRISGQYDTTNIIDILREWALLLDLTYKQEGDKYIITSLNCS